MLKCVATCLIASFQYIRVIPGSKADLFRSWNRSHDEAEVTDLSPIAVTYTRLCYGIVRWFAGLSRILHLWRSGRRWSIGLSWLLYRNFDSWSIRSCINPVIPKFASLLLCSAVKVVEMGGSPPPSFVKDPCRWLIVVIDWKNISTRLPSNANAHYN